MHLLDSEESYGWGELRLRQGETPFTCCIKVGSGVKSRSYLSRFIFVDRLNIIKPDSFMGKMIA